MTWARVRGTPHGSTCQAIATSVPTILVGHPRVFAHATSALVPRDGPMFSARIGSPLMCWASICPLH